MKQKSFRQTEATAGHQQEQIQEYKLYPPKHLLSPTAREMTMVRASCFTVKMGLPVTEALQSVTTKQNAI